ncbi:uncharacterized protein PHALS_01076 [Plasmopara halstedii]|uniref:Uncharacterized protein n=1 Tax=Plasmopara halstedii TaxID=4781 RepID=A0A0P1ATT1_PLAHL|nr:uncharacterized protein PHALS_01076 [Plasmopara halstedii]CEG44736.1 hypothetical protein PHALS_01076 [Plasmopara halstedii]|eukprot:XP_024581105.1 hypothetical protein PHALS_01076 [Plasmopara halstedii]
MNAEQIEYEALAKPGHDSDWVGTIRLDGDSEGKAKLWKLLASEFRIIWHVSLTGGALTAQFGEKYALYAANNLEFNHPTSFCQVDDDEDDSKIRARAFTYNDEILRSRKTRGIRKQT